MQSISSMRHSGTANLPDIQFAGQESVDKVISDKGVVTGMKGDSGSFNESFIA